MEQTFGQQRVRARFNPSQEDAVDANKAATAAILDTLKARMDASENGEEKRLLALAMTGYEEACMWAVKALTTNK